jgi:hypothetical protein
LNRRELLKGLIAGIATVAIASRLAPKFPEVTKAVRLAFTITEEEIEDGLYGEIAHRYAQALAESMRETREMTASGVLA